MLVHHWVRRVCLSHQSPENNNSHLQRHVNDDEKVLRAAYLVGREQHRTEQGAGAGQFIENECVAQVLVGVQRPAEPIFLGFAHCEVVQLVIVLREIERFGFLQGALGNEGGVGPFTRIST